MLRQAGMVAAGEEPWGAAADDQTVIFRPRRRMIRLRKSWLLPLQGVCVLLELAVIALGVWLRSGFLVVLGLCGVAVCAGAFALLASQSRGDDEQVRPRMLLRPDGLHIEGALSLGPIPWDEIADVRTTRFLLSPVVLIVPRDLEGLRARLGPAARGMWAYRLRGGLGVNGAAFGLDAGDLAARINRYRERGLS